jgi:hypothetical protein
MPADKIVRWFREGQAAGIKTEIAGTYYADADYIPLWVNLTCRRSPSGSRPLKIDITKESPGYTVQESIFDDKPALNDQKHKYWTTIPEDVIREGSILRLNLDQIASEDPGEDLTVELGLKEV